MSEHEDDEGEEVRPQVEGADTGGIEPRHEPAEEETDRGRAEACARSDQRAQESAEQQVSWADRPREDELVGAPLEIAQSRRGHESHHDEDAEQAHAPSIRTTTKGAFRCNAPIGPPISRPSVLAATRARAAKIAAVAHRRGWRSW